MGENAKHKPLFCLNIKYIKGHMIMHMLNSFMHAQCLTTISFCRTRQLGQLGAFQLAITVLHLEIRHISSKDHVRAAHGCDKIGKLIPPP